MDKVKKQLAYLFYISFIFITLLLLIGKLRTGRASIFGFRPVFVLTGSMEPVIHTNSLILTKVTDAASVNIGDIVVYKEPVLINGRKTHHSLSIVHRIINKNEDGSFIFKGDANATPDEKAVKPDQILYKVIDTDVFR